MTTPQTDLTARLLAKLHEWGDGLVWLRAAHGE